MFSTRIPSKTFLLGEYVVLDGGPGLILTTPPYFTMQMNQHLKCFSPFHPQSPAGLWLEKNADFFNEYHLDFLDPHDGKGGFGSSGAEFISVYSAKHSIQKTVAGIEQLLADYFSVIPIAEPVLPSGADLVAQVCGGITYWHRANQQLDSLDWPFQNLSYCLIRTGYKHPTHHGLKKVSANALTAMNHLVEQGYAAFKSKNSLALTQAVKEYATWMRKVDCVLAATEELLQFLSGSKLIDAAKGCGALGADVILILLATEKLPAFLAWLQTHKLKPVVYGPSYSLPALAATVSTYFCNKT